MSFDRSRVPGILEHLEAQGQTFTAKGKWRTGPCAFHGGHDSTRINTQTNGWVCMSCGVHGGDAIAYHMQFTGVDFTTACKDLGCWIEDGKPATQHKPTPLPARQALQLLAAEANLAAIAACNVGRGVVLNDVDLQRLLIASNRITGIMEVFA